MSRALSPLQAVSLGLAVLAGLGLAAFGLFVVGNRQMLFDSFTLLAQFKDAQRVEPGAKVYIHGMEAGQVESVELTGDGFVQMRLRISGDFRKNITKQSKVQIAGEGLFGGRVLNILPNQATKQLVSNGDVLAEQPGGDTVAKLKKEIKDEIKSITTEIKDSIAGAKLDETVAKFNGLLDGAQTALNDTRHMISSVKQNSDAIKSLPVISSYVVDLNAILNRPSDKRYRMHFAADQLFEPDRAVLTDNGKTVLDKAAAWLNKRKENGSEVVIASFADPKQDASFAQTLTQKRSEVVAEYLTKSHNVHRMGWWWWSYRNVRAVGCGTSPSPVPEAEKLPPNRIEVIVFVPESS